MIKKYRKKPLVIEAVQFLDNVKEVEMFVGKELAGNKNGTGSVQELIIDTLEGEMIASKTDYIIRGLKGEFYPCKKYIFEMTYDEHEVESVIYCERCDSEIKEYVVNGDNERICKFCWGTHIGNIIKYKKQYDNDTYTLARSIAECFNILDSKEKFKGEI
jgi:hypothetical protein